MNKKIQQISSAIHKKLIAPPTVGVILGSGLGGFADDLPDAIRIPYSDLPGMPLPTVQGHAGSFVCTDIGNTRALLMQGRFHPYEGYDLHDVTLPIRVMASIGVRTLIVTNAVGGVNLSYTPGDLMVISDHVNFGQNPLFGANLDEFGPRFPDMTRAYDIDLRKLAHQKAKELNIPLKEGVYFYMRGPSYETPAEIRAIRILGADAVGMSTVAEVTVARHCGMRVLGISCISNMAAGVLDQPLNHQEVIETAALVRTSFSSLIKEVLYAL